MDSVQNKLVVFDLDGTLNRTDLYSVPAHRTAFEELGMFGITDEEIISNFGAGDSEIDAMELMMIQITTAISSGL